MRVFHRSHVVIGLLICAAVFCVITAPTPDALYAKVYGEKGILPLKNVTGIVWKQSDVGEVDQRVTLRINGVGEFGGTQYFVRIKMPLSPRVLPGDAVTFSCTLRKPDIYEGFDYPRYLLRYKILGECSVFQAQVTVKKEIATQGVTAVANTAPNIQQRAQEQYHSAYRALIQFKIYMMQRVMQNLPMPESSLVLGIVFGEMRALPEYLNDAFQRTGTTHLLVISGSNIALIIAWLSGGLQRFFSRRASFIVCIMCITAYTIMTGIQPSATRAAIFGTTVLWATVLGRPDQALRALILTGCVMTVSNPLIAIIDAGFQLSFLASLSMILWSEKIQEKLWMIPEKFGMREGTSATMAATLMCTPLLASQFHTISFISPLANLFLVPLMSAFLPIGIVQVVLSSASLYLGQLFAVPFVIALRYCIDLVEIGAGFSWAAAPFTSITGMMCGLWYICIAVITLKRLFFFRTPSPTTTL